MLPHMNADRHQVCAAIDSDFLVLLPDGSEELLPMDRPDDACALLADIGDGPLLAYVKSEELGQSSGEQPPSVAAMRRLQLVDYEPASDPGNLRLYPAGAFVFRQLRRWADHIAMDRFGAMQIQTPMLYSWDDPQIREQAGSFHENHYVVHGPEAPDRDLILRFAGDFGLFKMMRQAQFSYRMLPLRVYEFSPSFRYERRGALSGLKRLRGFSLPDIHCFCSDLEQSREEYQKLYQAYEELADGAGVSCAICMRVAREFYEGNRARIAGLAALSGRPVLVEVLSHMKHYWALKHELQAIDSVGGAVQLSTVQLDVQDAGVYGISYVARDGGRRGRLICHSSVGSIERWLYAVLEQALAQPRPHLPLWLAPAQVRLLPVSQQHVEYCLQLQLQGVRVEVDDSDEPLARKVARAGRDWSPYAAVVGDRERSSGLLAVSCRSSGTRGNRSPDALAAEIRSACHGMPPAPLPVPSRMSMRPRFC